MDWWLTVIILSGIGLISVIIGLFAGIPLSNIILRRREQVSIGKNQESPEFKPQYTTTDQLDELLKKYGVFELKTADLGRIETAEKESDEAEIPVAQSEEAETPVEQVEPLDTERILFELEKNLALSSEPRPDNPEPFQTAVWDESPDIPNILAPELKWELAESYLDMYAANNIVWFLKEFDTKSPILENQYVKMCNQIAITLSKVIQVLQTVEK